MVKYITNIQMPDGEVLAIQGTYNKVVTPYKYANSKTTFYWYKIINKADLVNIIPVLSDIYTYKIDVHSDTNYPQCASYILNVSTYTNSMSVSLINIYRTSSTTPSLKLAIDSAGNIYIQAKAVWNSQLKVTIETGDYTPPLTNMGDADFGSVAGFTSKYMIENNGAFKYTLTTQTISNVTDPFTNMNTSTGLPVGTIFSHTCSADFVPENSLPCDGTEYNSSQFTDFYTNYLVDGKLNTCTYEEYQSDLNTYGKCAKFGVDTTSGKFKVPYIPNGTFIQQAMTNDELGKAYNAGLPNITGSSGTQFIPDISGGRNNTDGAITDKYAGNVRWAGTNRMDYSIISFNASQSNPIYGNSDTVQPSAISLRYFVVVATGTINQAKMDWNAWASGLQGKINIDHSNDTKPYITESYINGTSGYRVWSDKLCEQWGEVASVGENSKVTISLLKPYLNTEYNVMLTGLGGNRANGQYTNGQTVMTRNTDSFIMETHDYTFGRAWRAIGYIE